MALNKWEGRLSLDSSGTHTITIDEDSGVRSAVVTITAGDYYLTSTTPLLSTIATAITNNGTLTGTYAMSLDDTSDSATGKITLTLSSGATNFRVNAVTATLKAYLGWDGDTFPAGYGTSFQGARQARYLWLPNVRRTNLMGGEPASVSYDLGILLEDGTMAIAPSGTAIKLAYNTRRVDSCEYQYLLGKKTLLALEATGNESWERYYQDVVYMGYPARLHPDRSDDAVYFAWKMDSTQTGMGVRPMIPGRVGGAQSLWQLQLPMIANV